MQLVVSVWYQSYAICNRLMGSLRQGPLGRTKALWAEQRPDIRGKTYQPHKGLI